MTASGVAAATVVDLRSDTLTKPTPGMLEAMVAAPLGDDVYSEDPTVNRLQERVAGLFGKEAGLFTPTGSMSNQLGLRTLVHPGDEVVTDTFAHIVRAELGGLAAQGGITTRTYDSPQGVIDLGRLAATIRPKTSPYLVGTTTVSIENTHNFDGGRVQPFESLVAARELADAEGLTLHLDGARIWNAHVATGVPLAEYGRLFDTISVCFSKGLGAPIGSMLLSTSDRIDQARVLRKRLGAGMRQVGILAAAADFALKHQVDRLAEDHRRARTLAQAIEAAAPGVADPAPDTNIVRLSLRGSGWTSPELDLAAQARGVTISVIGEYEARLVTYLGLTDRDVEFAAEVLGSLLAAR